MSKFQLQCSCTTCGFVLSTANLGRHVAKEHPAEPKGNCAYCGAFLFRNTKFCDQKCAAKKNNAERTPESRAKQGKTLANTLGLDPNKSKRRPNPNPAFCYVGYCEVCSSLVKSRRKTCGDECFKIKLSRVAASRDTNRNRGRHKASYLELSFFKWLVDHNITKFETEKCSRMKTNDTTAISFLKT